jgi:spore coat protein U-like protein
MRIRWLALAVITLAATAQNAEADTCNVTLTRATASPSLSYDPFEGVRGAATVEVEFVNGGAEPCTLALAVGQASGGQRFFTNRHGRLAYAVKLAGGEMPNDLTSPTGLVTVEGGNGKRTKLTLAIDVAEGQIAPAGRYRDEITVRAYDLTARAFLGKERNVQLSAEVRSRAQVNIAGASGAFDRSFALPKIDFGEIVPGAERTAFVQIRATSAVTIDVESKNHGVLRHRQLGDTVKGLPYTVRLDGKQLNLRGGASIDRHPPLTLEGVSYPMIVRLGDTPAPMAGEYQDTITISVCPR